LELQTQNRYETIPKAFLNNVGVRGLYFEMKLASSVAVNLVAVKLVLIVEEMCEHR
jgi:hypothetical protein